MNVVMLEHGHAAADRRNLALHRAALAKLRSAPELRQRCLAIVERWMAQPEQASARGSLQRWRQMLLSWSVDEIGALILDPEEGQALRQCSPLGPALTPQERWAVLREVNHQLAREAARLSA